MPELILALDLPTGLDALRLLDRIPEVRWVKVGSVLMTREGGDLIRELHQRGLKVFLDLKWHDIPSTVAGAVTAAAELGVTMATVHTLGGTKMMQTAAAASGPSLGLVGVTVLTSHDDMSYGDAVGRGSLNLMEEVLRQAGNAAKAGLRGVVCSPREISDVRARLGAGAWIVVPGIRRPEDHPGDQVRTAGPAEAAQAGATHLVVGRPVLEAGDPAGTFRSFLSSL